MNNTGNGNEEALCRKCRKGELKERESECKSTRNHHNAVGGSIPGRTGVVFPSGNDEAQCPDQRWDNVLGLVNEPCRPTTKTQLALEST